MSDTPRHDPRPIPRELWPDSTLALLREPYRFISRRCQSHGSDVFQTRLLLRPTICLTGAAAAELFYDQDRFRRHGATPGRIQKTLQGRGGVQSLDGAAHRHRKALFLSLLQGPRLEDLVRRVDQQWQEDTRQWSDAESVVLYDRVRELLCRALCDWAGVPLEEEELDKRTRQLTDLFDQAGAVGPAHWWGRLQRRRAERWIGGWIQRVRRGELPGSEGTPLHVVATHRDLDGRPLDRRIAAVELLNILRPAVAVGVYITFVAHALHEQPVWRDRLKRDESGEATGRFVQEVRRFYPFFPAIAARTRDAFVWQGYLFPAGVRVMLDLFGTNRDPRAWDQPEAFDPDRYLHTPLTPFNHIPQGGGEHHQHHRCAGEWVTLELMKQAARFLARLQYDVPEQDLSVDEHQLPARPTSGFMMTRVRPAD